MSLPKYSLVLPCFNEQGAILETLSELRRELGDPAGYEIIVVDDGSTDGTAILLADIAAKEPFIKVLTHDRNRGYGAAIKTGMAYAASNLIVITDSDGTYPNDRIPELVRLAEGQDMVVGARTGPNVVYPLIRKVPKEILRRWASWLAGQRIPDINSGLRVFRRDVAQRFITILPNTFSFTTTITLAMLTTWHRVLFVPINYKSRTGRSKIKPVRDTLRFIQIILRTGMYFAPLRALMPLIVVLSAAFVASLAYDVVILADLTERTLMLLLFAMNTFVFALLADMIDRRSR